MADYLRSLGYTLDELHEFVMEHAGHLIEEEYLDRLRPGEESVIEHRVRRVNGSPNQYVAGVYWKAETWNEPKTFLEGSEAPSVEEASISLMHILHIHVQGLTKDMSVVEQFALDEGQKHSLRGKQTTGALSSLEQRKLAANNMQTSHPPQSKGWPGTLVAQIGAQQTSSKAAGAGRSSQFPQSVQDSVEDGIGTAGQGLGQASRQRQNPIEVAEAESPPIEGTEDSGSIS